MSRFSENPQYNLVQIFPAIYWHIQQEPSSALPKLNFPNQLAKSHHVPAFKQQAPKPLQQLQFVRFVLFALWKQIRRANTSHLEPRRETRSIPLSPRSMGAARFFYSLASLLPAAPAPHPFPLHAGVCRACDAANREASATLAPSRTLGHLSRGPRRALRLSFFLSSSFSLLF